MERLGACEPNAALFLFGIYIYLDVGQQLGGILDFINEDWRGVTLHEQRRVMLGEIAHVRVIQRDILALRGGQVLEQGCFPYLPGACHQQDRKHGGNPEHGILNGSFDVHMGSLLSIPQKTTDFDYSKL